MTGLDGAVDPTGSAVPNWIDHFLRHPKNNDSARLSTTLKEAVADAALQAGSLEIAQMRASKN